MFLLASSGTPSLWLPNCPLASCSSFSLPPPVSLPCSSCSHLSSPPSCLCSFPHCSTYPYFFPVTLLLPTLAILSVSSSLPSEKKSANHLHLHWPPIIRALVVPCPMSTSWSSSALAHLRPPLAEWAPHAPQRGGGGADRTSLKGYCSEIDYYYF